MCGAQFLRRAAAPAGRIGCVLRRAKAERRTNAARLVGDEAARKRAQGEESEDHARHRENKDLLRRSPSPGKAPHRLTDLSWKPPPTGGDRPPLASSGGRCVRAQFLRRVAAPAGVFEACAAKVERRTNAARLVGDEAARKRAQGEKAQQNARHDLRVQCNST